MYLRQASTAGGFDRTTVSEVDPSRSTFCLSTSLTMYTPVHSFPCVPPQMATRDSGGKVMHSICGQGLDVALPVVCCKETTMQEQTGHELTWVTCDCGMWVSQCCIKENHVSLLQHRGKRPIGTVGLWIIARTSSFTTQLSWQFTKLDGRFSKQWTGLLTRGKCLTWGGQKTRWSNFPDFCSLITDHNHYSLRLLSIRESLVGIRVVFQWQIPLKVTKVSFKTALHFFLRCILHKTLVAWSFPWNTSRAWRWLKPTDWKSSTTIVVIPHHVF